MRRKKFWGYEEHYVIRTRHLRWNVFEIKVWENFFFASVKSYKERSECLFINAYEISSFPFFIFFKKLFRSFDMYNFFTHTRPYLQHIQTYNQKIWLMYRIFLLFLLIFFFFLAYFSFSKANTFLAPFLVIRPGRNFAHGCVHSLDADMKTRLRSGNFRGITLPTSFTFFYSSWYFL